LAIKLAGAFNESAEINTRKYAWQFGTDDFKTAIRRTMAEAVPVDYTCIRTPALLLMSEGEAEELKRQTRLVAEDFRRRGVDMTLREFTAVEGADGHCQVNNLRLAHLVVFDWLDRLFLHDPGDVRLRC